MVATPKHNGQIETHVKNRLSFLITVVNSKKLSSIAVYSNTNERDP